MAKATFCPKCGSRHSFERSTDRGETWHCWMCGWSPTRLPDESEAEDTPQAARRRQAMGGEPALLRAIFGRDGADTEA